MRETSYIEIVEQANNDSLEKLLVQLPVFCRDYVNEMRSIGRSSRTVVEYTRDILLFLQYIISADAVADGIEGFKDMDITAMQPADLERVRKIHIDRYIAHMISYTDSAGKRHRNGEASRARKLSAIRGLYDFMCRSELITVNPTSLIKTPDIKQKAVDALDPGEVAQLLDVVESGTGLSKGAAIRHKDYAARDVAILTLLLGTGIRVSELVGLNMTDYSPRDGSIVVVRKGGNRDKVYCSDEVSEALEAYLDARKKQTAKTGHDGALFLSNRMQRISVDAVQLLVKKYSLAALNKDLHPHSMRSTFATNLLSETDGDVVTVADALGHKNIQTTKDHYLKASEERKRNAMRNCVKLRKD